MSHIKAKQQRLRQFWGEIQRAYPELADVNFQLMSYREKSRSRCYGWWKPRVRELYVCWARPEHMGRATVVHEAAHALDTRERPLEDCHDEVFKEIEARLREEFL